MATMLLQDQIAVTLITAVSAMSLLIGLAFRLFIPVPRKDNAAIFAAFSRMAFGLFVYFAAFGFFYGNNFAPLRQTANAVCFMVAPITLAFLIDFLLKLFGSKPLWPNYVTYLLAGISAALIPLAQYGFGVRDLLYFSAWVEPPIIFFMLPWTLISLSLIAYAYYLIFNRKRTGEYLERRPDSKRRIVFLRVAASFLLLCSIVDIFTTDIPPVLWAGAFIMLLAGAVLLAAEIRAMRGEIDSLYEQVIHDPLTKAFSRVFFETELEKCLYLVRRSHDKMWLVMLDIDDFKIVNDTHGHLVGDHVLQALSKALMYNLRPSDIVGRLGGDEFAILITGNDDEQEVRAALARVQLKIAELEIHDLVKNRPVDIHFSCSFGLALLTWPDEMSELAEARASVIHAADKALYQAKHGGKNRLVFAG